MNGRYVVKLNSEEVGWVDVSREGLYYFFSCRCNLKDQQIYQLFVNGISKIGILVPMDSQFGLDTRLPAKYFSETHFEFQLVPKNQLFIPEFVPISPAEPFEYLQHLQNAFLERRNGKTGIHLYIP